MEKYKERIHRYLTTQLGGYCVGMFITAVGVCFCVASQLGTSPTGSMPYVISVATGLDLGLCTTAVLVVIMILQMIILGRQFKLVRLVQLLASVLFGGFISVTNHLFQWMPIADSYPKQLLYSCCGVFFIAVGVTMYMEYDDVLCLPVEGIVQAIVIRFHMEFPTAKTIVDATLVTTAVLASLLWTGEIVGVREGTLMVVLGVGNGIRVIRRELAKWRARKENMQVNQ